MLPRLLLVVQILFISIILSKSEDSFSKDELVYSIVIYRHGDRTPIEPYPNDPYKDVSNWPVGFGQLTNKGKLQEYDLGQWIRNRYSNYLPKLYSKDDIYVQSTNLDRTLMSALSNLAGLYPPIDHQVWNEKLLWQPIPVHTIPAELDNVLGMTKSCARYDLLLEQLQNSPKFVHMKKVNKDLFSYLSLHSGKKVEKFFDILYIYNTLYIEELYNFTLPEWTKAVYPTKMKPLADFAFAVSTFTSDMARFKVGTILERIIRQFKNETALEAKKFMMFSAHDTTIAAVLNSLHMFEYHSPPYSSTILFELRRSNNGSYVNIFYKNSSIPQEMTLDGCDFNCPLDKFVTILEPLCLTPKEWTSECQSQYFGFVPNEIIQDDYVAVCTIICLLLLCSIIIIFIFVKLRRDRQNQYIILPHEDF